MGVSYTLHKRCHAGRAHYQMLSKPLSSPLPRDNNQTDDGHSPLSYPGPHPWSHECRGSPEAGGAGCGSLRSGITLGVLGAKHAPCSPVDPLPTLLGAPRGRPTRHSDNDPCPGRASRRAPHRRQWRRTAGQSVRPGSRPHCLTGQLCASARSRLLSRPGLAPTWRAQGSQVVPAPATCPHPCSRLPSLSSPRLRLSPLLSQSLARAQAPGRQANPQDRPCSPARARR